MLETEKRLIHEIRKNQYFHNDFRWFVCGSANLSLTIGNICNNSVKWGETQRISIQLFYAVNVLQRLIYGSKP